MKIPEVVTEAVESPRAAGKLNQFRLDEHGREILDSRPMEPPVGYVKRESISDQIRRMVLQVSQEIASNEVESLEESNDFYVEDDPGSAAISPTFMRSISGSVIVLYGVGFTPISRSLALLRSLRNHAGKSPIGQGGSATIVLYFFCMSSPKTLS